MRSIYHTVGTFTRFYRLGALALPLLALTGFQLAKDKTLPKAQTVGEIEVFARFYGPTPIEVVTSPKGRIFLSFPRAFDQGQFSFAEIKNGKAIPYPSLAVNRLNAPHAERLVSVQGCTTDARNRLWLLDTGIVGKKPTVYGGPKLVCVDLDTNKIVKKILFPRAIAGPNAYLNDVRVHLGIGRAGTAFITDSSEKGPNAIVVVDLASGKAMRRLNDHPSVKFEPGYIPVVEGYELLKRAKGKPPERDKTGVDGLAIADGSLFYGPNEGLGLYSVPLKLLADPATSEAGVEAAVKSYGPKPGPADGIAADAQGRIYTTDYAHDAIHRRNADGTYTTLAKDPRMVWPDAIAFAGGYMYFTADQLNRQAKYHNGKDLRKRPIVLFRMRTDAKPNFPR